MTVGLHFLFQYCSLIDGEESLKTNENPYNQISSFEVEHVEQITVYRTT